MNHTSIESPRSLLLVVIMAAASMLLPPLVLAGCDSDEEPTGGEDTAADLTEVDTTPAIEPCPATGAVLQVSPLRLELLAGEAGTPSTATIKLNSGGEGQLCFPTSGVITVDPEVEGLEFGPLMLDGVEVDALDPGDQGTIEVTWTPPAGRSSGQSAISIAPSNATPASLQFMYDASGSVDADAIGTIIAEVELPYIYDAARWEADANQERELHPEGLMRTRGLTGTLDGDAVPSVDAVTTRVYALHTNSRLIVEQRSFEGDGFDSPLVTPQVEIVFPDDMLEPGTYTIDPSMPETAAVLKVIELVPGEFPDDPDERCLLAVGFGELTISTAENTDQEGGTLGFRSDVINLYRADATPAGDLIQEVGESCIIGGRP